MSDTTICLPVLPHYTLVISKTQVAGGLAARVGTLIRGRRLAAFANKAGKKFDTGHQPPEKDKMSTDAIRFFLDRYALTNGDIDKLLAAALARGGDYADLYFEYRVANSVNIEEQIVKQAAKSISQGVGVRVIIGDKTGYAYTDDIDFD